MKYLPDRAGAALTVEAADAVLAGEVRTVFPTAAWRAESVIAAAELSRAMSTARSSGVVKAPRVAGAGPVLDALASTIAATPHRTATRAPIAMMALRVTIRSGES
jgi:hypothetical protein